MPRPQRQDVALWSYLSGAAAHLVPAVLLALHLRRAARSRAAHALSHARGHAHRGGHGAGGLRVHACRSRAAASAPRATPSRSCTRRSCRCRSARPCWRRPTSSSTRRSRADTAGPSPAAASATWTVGAVVGRGAMGDVYEASRVGGGKRAALKILHRALAMDPTHVKRFLREAQIVFPDAQPASSCRLLEFGNLESPGDSHEESPPYIAMELLEGHDLGWHLRHEGRMTRELALGDDRPGGRRADRGRRGGRRPPGPQAAERLPGAARLRGGLEASSTSACPSLRPTWER